MYWIRPGIIIVIIPPSNRSSGRLNCKLTLESSERGTLDTLNLQAIDLIEMSKIVPDILAIIA